MGTDSGFIQIRKISGDILIIISALLTVDVLVVMPAKISAVVLKSDYREVFVYERILEDKAKTTKENLRNIAEMIPKDEPVVMISSNYHMDCVVRIAGEEGFTQVMRFPADSSVLTYGACMLFEVILDLNDLIK